MKPFKFHFVVFAIALLLLSGFGWPGTAGGGGGGDARKVAGDDGAIPFDLDRWVYDADRVEVRDSKTFPGGRELHHTGYAPGTIAYVKDLRFADGTIECDMAGGSYLGISFRVRPVPGQPAPERVSEDVYLRIDGNQRAATVQYYPHGKLKQEELHLPPYEERVRLIKQDEWFHVRLEIKGKQAKVFLDGRAEPVQVIDRLMHDHADGSVGVRSWGGRFANLKVVPARPAGAGE